MSKIALTDFLSQLKNYRYTCFSYSEILGLNSAASSPRHFVITWICISKCISQERALLFSPEKTAKEDVKIGYIGSFQKPMGCFL